MAAGKVNNDMIVINRYQVAFGVHSTSGLAADDCTLANVRITTWL